MSPERRQHKEEEKADQLIFDLSQPTKTDSNPVIIIDTDGKIMPDAAKEKSAIKTKNKEKKKKPTRKELKHEKKYYPQIWEFEGKGGVHDRMQKRPANRPDVVNPRQIYVEQEKSDAEKFRQKKSIRGFRLKANPDIVLTSEQFSIRTKMIMSLSEEEMVNLFLADAEIYDRRVRARKSAYKSKYE